MLLTQPRMHFPHNPWRLALLSLLLLAGCESDKDRDIRRIDITRRIGRLAPLPPQALGVQVHELSNSFAASFWLRFEAPPEALASFLAASPGLAGVAACGLCTPEQTEAAAETRLLKAHLPSSGSVALSVRREDSCEWNPIQVPSTLTWFDLGEVRTGRLYTIPQDHDANGGTVLVDEARHIVYVTVSHS